MAISRHSEAAPGDKPTATVFWDPAEVFAELGDPKIIDCTCTPRVGNKPCDPSWLANNGGEFPLGTWDFSCSATDNQCGNIVTHNWKVSVSKLPSGGVSACAPVLGRSFSCTRCRRC